MDVEDHGGSCCGIRCICDFYQCNEDNIADLDSALRQWPFARDDGRNILAEVVLIDEQLRQGWGDILKQRDFVRVNRFYNSNSGNMCNVFHRVPDPTKGARRKDPWTGLNRGEVNG